MGFKGPRDIVSLASNLSAHRTVIKGQDFHFKGGKTAVYDSQRKSGMRRGDQSKPFTFYRDFLMSALHLAKSQ